MKPTKEKSKIKSWFKKLFKKRTHSPIKPKGLPSKKEKQKNSEKKEKSPNTKQYKYSYLKTDQQREYYKNMRLRFSKKPKGKEIKKPRIKRNQEGWKLVENNLKSDWARALLEMYTVAFVFRIRDFSR